MADATETIVNGSRHCSKCGTFLGMTCDPFGRRECPNRCWRDQTASQPQETPAP